MPSLGLIGCCSGRTGKSTKSCPDEQPSKSGLTVPASKESPYGVGIGYQHDKSGALIVIELSPGGMKDSKLEIEARKRLA